MALNREEKTRPPSNDDLRKDHLLILERLNDLKSQNLLILTRLNDLNAEGRGLVIPQLEAAVKLAGTLSTKLDQKVPDSHVPPWGGIETPPQTKKG